MQRLLWAYVEQNVVSFYSLTAADAERMLILMQQYWDSPMDLANASLVATAKALHLDGSLTLDRHFHTYRIQDVGSFHVVT